MSNETEGSRPEDQNGRKERGWMLAASILIKEAGEDVSRADDGIIYVEGTGREASILYVE